MTEHIVLRADSLAAPSKYMEAVAQVIADIRRATGKTLVDIAEDIDASLGTVSNAANCKSELGATFLARLGQTYGAAFLNPYLALFGAQAAPIEKKAMRDILPIVTRVAHKVSFARSDESPGGKTEVPQERFGYLPDLKELNHETGCLISEIEGAR